MGNREAENDADGRENITLTEEEWGGNKMKFISNTQQTVVKQYQAIIGVITYVVQVQ